MSASQTFGVKSYSEDIKRTTFKASFELWLIIYTMEHKVNIEKQEEWKI